jgi:lipopolysaccharide transport protein LptA
MTRLAILWLLLGALIPVPSPAQGVRFATDASAPLSAKADKIIWQQAIGRADFSGAAHITQGPLSIQADTMQLLMSPSGVAQSLVSQGQVVVLSSPGPGPQDGVHRADADRAHYDLIANTLLLSGNVQVRQNGAGKAGKMSGASLKIDMQTGLARILGAPVLSGETPKNGKPGRARIELE